MLYYTILYYTCINQEHLFLLIIHFVLLALLDFFLSPRTFFFNILFCRFDEFLERTQIEEEKSPLSFIFSMSQKRKADVLPADKVGRNNTTTNFCCCLFVYSYGYSNMYFSRRYQA